MRRPSSTALSSRARTLLEHMHLREHWVYAVPISETAGDLVGAVTAIVITPREDLEVTLVEARGEEAAIELAQLLQRTGFFAQSTLLESAFDVDTDDAHKALLTLAHMVVQWDTAWRELFALHLEHNERAVRQNAVRALSVAATISGARDECTALLQEALAREADVGLRGLMESALHAPDQ